MLSPTQATFTSAWRGPFEVNTNKNKGRWTKTKYNRISFSNTHKIILWQVISLNPPGQILSLPCGRAFYILRVRTTIQQGQPMDFLMLILFFRTAQAVALCVLWQSQTESRPLKIFSSQLVHALENCYITIRCNVHPDLHFGSRQSQVESIDHWWTKQPWHLAENDGHEPPVILRVRWGAPMYSDWVKSIYKKLHMEKSSRFRKKYLAWGIWVRVSERISEQILVLKVSEWRGL